MHLRVDADLDIDIDGQSSRLEGRGDELQFLLKDDAALAALLTDGSRFTRRFADFLNASGLTVTVSSASVPLLKMGYAVSFLPSRLVLGSRHAAPTSFASAARLLRVYWVARRNGR